MKNKSTGCGDADCMATELGRENCPCLAKNHSSRGGGREQNNEGDEIDNSGIRDHVASPDCWCEPTLVDGTYMHKHVH